MCRHVAENTCLVTGDPLLDIIDTAVDQDCLRDLIFIPAGRDILEEFFRVMLVIDQDDRLRRIDRIVDPPHENDPQDDYDQIDPGQSEHGAYMVEKAPAADQGQLDICDDIGTYDRTDLGDDDILNPHVAHFKCAKKLRHQEYDQGIQPDQHPVAPPPVKDLDDGTAIIFGIPDIGKMSRLHADH